MVEQRRGVVEAELDQAAGHPGLPLGLQGLPADEPAGLVPRHPPGEPSLQWGVLIGDVVTPVPVGRLHP